MEDLDLGNQCSAVNLEQNKKALDIEVSERTTWEENGMGLLRIDGG